MGQLIFEDEIKAQEIIRQYRKLDKYKVVAAAGA